MDKDLLKKYHHENVKILEDAIEQIQSNLRSEFVKEYYAQRNEKQKIKRKIAIYTRIVSGLVVSWCEEIIKRLYHENNAFTEEQIEILHTHNLQQKWEIAFKIAFCKAYNVRNPLSSPIYKDIDPLQATNVSRSAKDKYQNVRSLIEVELLPAFNLRNKVQHGEWLKAFEPPNSLNFSPELTANVNKENIIMLQTKINQFKAVYQMIHDLAVFKQGNNTVTFERDFDDNYERIESNRRHLTNRKLRDYQQDLVGRRERGLRWREQNEQSNR